MFLELAYDSYYESFTRATTHQTLGGILLLLLLLGVVATSQSSNASSYQPISFQRNHGDQAVSCRRLLFLCLKPIDCTGTARNQSLAPYDSITGGSNNKEQLLTCAFNLVQALVVVSDPLSFAYEHIRMKLLDILAVDRAEPTTLTNDCHVVRLASFN